MAAQTTADRTTAFPPIPRQADAPALERLPVGSVPAAPEWWADEDDDEDDEVEHPRNDRDDQWPLVLNRRRLRDEGMATAEYAVATLAACGFAGVLLAVVRGGEVQQMLTTIVKRALTLE